MLSLPHMNKMRHISWAKCAEFKFGFHFVANGITDLWWIQTSDATMVDFSAILVAGCMHWTLQTMATMGIVTVRFQELQALCWDTARPRRKSCWWRIQLVGIPLMLRLHNSDASAIELRLSCIKWSKWLIELSCTTLHSTDKDRTRQPPNQVDTSLENATPNQFTINMSVS